jgi:alkylhydroperoxidase/carboxymuconolactone decarboxylase family protein YurZ
MAVFAGFPAAINALNIAREVFKERGVTVGT